jgi:ATPase subunit of ABC transporter with duplicated ATPase domains
MHEHEARLEALEPLEKRRSDAKLRLPPRRWPAAARRARMRPSFGRRAGRGVRGAPGTATAPPGARRRLRRVPWLELRRGDRIGIVGPNGAGKTTLLRTIAGELAPLDGVLDWARTRS